MGFMDKAKQMAEQAQQKLDEVQQTFNDKQAATHAPPPPPGPPAAKPTGVSQADKERVAPPPVSSGDPLKR